MLVDCTSIDHESTWEYMYLVYLLNSAPHHWFIVCWVFIASSPPPPFHPAGEEPVSKLDYISPKWISTRFSLPSEGSANTRKFYTYGFVYPRSSSPSTWWWASLQEPRRRTAAGRARAQQPGISPPPPVHSTWTSACRTLLASPRMSSCRVTARSASHAATDGCTARRLSRVPQSPRYATVLMCTWNITCLIRDPTCAT